MKNAEMRFHDQMSRLNEIRKRRNEERRQLITTWVEEKLFPMMDATSSETGTFCIETPIPVMDEVGFSAEILGEVIIKDYLEPLGYHARITKLKLCADHVLPTLCLYVSWDARDAAVKQAIKENIHDKSK